MQLLLQSVFYLAVARVVYGSVQYPIVVWLLASMRARRAETSTAVGSPVPFSVVLAGHDVVTRIRLDELAQVRRRRRSIEADDQTIQSVWLERAIVACLVAAFFVSYAGLTICYLLLGSLWAASKVFSRGATELAEPARRALRTR
jgi:hypothetical protein